MAHKAVFLDRDNTIIEDAEYSADPSVLAPLPGVADALKRLRRAGWKLIIVTNQSGIARGLFTEEALQSFHRHMLQWFAKRGVRFDGLYYCPHYPQGEAEEYVKTCDCRKPAPGMLLKAARELDIDLSRSWMVGDRPTDIGAGRAASCRTIRVLTGQSPEPDEPAADFTAADLVAAVDQILGAGEPAFPAPGSV